MNNFNWMQEWMDVWEKNTGEWMEQMVKSQHFVKNFLKTYEPVMNAGSHLKQTQSKMYEAIGLANREDVKKILQKLQDLEIKIGDLNETIQLKSLESMKCQEHGSMEEIHGCEE